MKSKLLSILLTLSLASAAIAQEKPRVFAWVPVGGSSNNPETRKVGWNIQAAGWDGFVKSKVVPALEAGCRDVFVHNPFGQLFDRSPGGHKEDMQYDQYIHAQEGVEGVHGPLPWLTEGFVEAWLPVTRGDYTGGEPVNVLAYLGSMRSDPDFLSLIEKGGLFAAVSRAERAVKPIVDAGFSGIIHDASIHQGEGSFTDLWVQAIRSRGLAVGIEPRPVKTHAHWIEGDKVDFVVTVRSLAMRSSPEFYEERVASIEARRAAITDKAERSKLWKPLRDAQGNAKYLRETKISDAEFMAVSEGIALVNARDLRKDKECVAPLMSRGWSVAVPIAVWAEVSKETRTRKASK